VYEGRTARGRVTHTVSRGRLAWADGVLQCAPGTGRYVPMAPFSPWLFAGLEARDAAAAAARQPVARAGDAPPHALREEL
jgi:dihydropyrimidinase